MKEITQKRFCLSYLLRDEKRKGIICLLVFVFLLGITPLQGEEIGKTTISEKEYGRWNFWDHGQTLGSWLRGTGDISVLQASGQQYALQSRGPFTPIDGTLGVVTSSGFEIHSPLWGGYSWNQSALSLENTRKMVHIQGPNVIRYGQRALFSILLLEEERPSEMEDFYLIRFLAGTNHYRSPFVRVGGYLTDTFSIHGSYEHFSDDGLEGREPTLNTDDFGQIHRLSLSGDWEIFKGLEIHGFIRGMTGRWGNTSPPSLMGGKREVNLANQGMTLKADWRKKLFFKVKYGLKWKGEEIFQDQGFYRSAYGVEPELAERRVFGDLVFYTKDFNPKWLGDSTEIGLRIEDEKYENPALVGGEARRLIHYGYVLQKRHFWKKIFMEGILGWEVTTENTLHLSGGIQSEWAIVPEKRFLGAYAYRHYRRPSWASLEGQFRNRSGSVILQGRTINSPEKTNALGLEYREKMEWIEGRAGIYYHEIHGRLFPRPNSSGIITYQAESQYTIWGIHLGGKAKLSSEFSLGASYSYMRLLPGTTLHSQGLKHRGNIEFTYQPGPENPLRGWTFGVRVRARDRLEIYDFLSQSTRRIDAHAGVDLRLSYAYPGFGRRLEFFLHYRDIFTGDQEEWTASPYNNQQTANPLAADRLLWLGLRLSL